MRGGSGQRHLQSNNKTEFDSFKIFCDELNIIKRSDLLQKQLLKVQLSGKPKTVKLVASSDKLAYVLNLFLSNVCV